MAQDTASQGAHSVVDGPPLVLTEADPPDVTHLVTETEEPVDSIFSEKQQRLLSHGLLTSWKGPNQDGRFVAMSNVGLFASVAEPPLVPDMLLSVDVELPQDMTQKQHRSYFQWIYGKAPDVVVEVVSNREGGELDQRLRGYARMGVAYYVVYDPLHCLGPAPLHAYERRGNGLAPMSLPFRVASLGLGLEIWSGRFEDLDASWLRWVDLEGRLIATGAERAEAAEKHANKMAEKLRSLGIDPEEL